jgi:hypothetical protein
MRFPSAIPVTKSTSRGERTSLPSLATSSSVLSGGPRRLDVLDGICNTMHISVMLQLLTSDVFAEWFAALDDKAAEDVATALDVVEQLGPTQAPAGSRESLLWYEHPSVSRFAPSDSLAWDLEAWGCFRDYARQVLEKLESPRFVSRLSRLGSKEATRVLKSIQRIKRAADPRMRWTLKLAGDPFALAAAVRGEHACAEVRRIYFEALEAAGFSVADVPAHSLALREFSRRAPGPAFRLLYGVDVEHETALFALGEWLDRAFYGDSVRRAERMWKQFLEGDRHAVGPAQLR